MTKVRKKERRKGGKIRCTASGQAQKEGESLCREGGRREVWGFGLMRNLMWHDLVPGIFSSEM